MVRFAFIALLLFGALSWPPTGGAGDATRVALKVARDLHLSFDHRLGAAEARRRTAARFAVLQSQFAASVGSSSIDWVGYVANVRAKALGQNATAVVLVGDTAVDITIHLPALLTPLAGNIEAYLTKTAVETLNP